LETEKRVLSDENERLLTLAGNTSAQSPPLTHRSSTASAQHNMSVNNESEYMDATQRLNDTENELSRVSEMNDVLVEENEQLKHRVHQQSVEIDELTTIKDKYRLCKDENDEYRSKIGEAQKAIAAMEVYKRKLDEQTDLKRELRILETKNSTYMQSAIELEEVCLYLYVDMLHINIRNDGRMSH
jgi:hypothetical protein